MRFVLACTLAAALAPATAAQQRLFTGAAFESACASARLKSWCEGFVVGVLQTDSLYQLAGDRPQPYCLPAYMNVPAIVALTYEFLDRNKDHRDLAASLAVGRTLRENFPCPAAR